MGMFTVSSVTDGDTFEVKGGWQWKKNNGSIETGTAVRPTGYDAPERWERGYEGATTRLRNLIQGEQVELRNCVDVDRGRLVCDVYFNGKNLAEYFPEYKR